MVYTRVCRGASSSTYGHGVRVLRLGIAENTKRARAPAKGKFAFQPRRDDGDAIRLPMRVMLCLTNRCTAVLEDHDRRVARGKIVVEIAPQPGDIVHLIDAQLREWTIVIAAIDHHIGFSYGRRERREVVRVQPDLRLGVNSSSGDIRAEGTGCCALAPVHAMRRVDERLAHNVIPEQSSFGVHLSPLIPFLSVMMSVRSLASQQHTACMPTKRTWCEPGGPYGCRNRPPGSVVAPSVQDMRHCT